jgi:hypothetical protein
MRAEQAPRSDAAERSGTARARSEAEPEEGEPSLLEEQTAVHAP